MVAPNMNTSSLFAVPEWDETKATVDYDFQKKKFKKNKPEKKKKQKSDDTTSPDPQLPPPKNYVLAPKQKQEKKKEPEKSLSIPMKAKDKMTTNKKKKNSQAPIGNSGNASSSLSDKLKDSLKSSRFRFLNECLYKSESKEAVKMFKEDPDAFGVYHEGYRQQVENWPTNPLDRIIKSVRKMPKEHILADFGCGDAKLSESVSNKIYSLDLVANKPDVIACDMAKTPLKSASVHAVVFCLSLMGTNLRDFLVEANRVLKPNGILKVAEVKSRFDKVDDFLQHVQSCGFKLVDKDVNGEFFYYFNFKKTGEASNKGGGFSLKPCLYKKR